MKKRIYRFWKEKKKKKNGRGNLSKANQKSTYLKCKNHKTPLEARKGYEKPQYLETEK